MSAAADIGTQVAGLSDRELTIMLIGEVKDIAKTVQSMAEDTGKVTHILYGNGEVGLLERVRSLENHPLLKPDAKIDERLKALETNPSITNNLKDQVNASNVEVADLKKDFDRLIRALKWVTALLATLVIMLGWQIVTGQVTLNFR